MPKPISKTDFLIDRLLQYSHLMRLDRPIGNLLLLWPLLWSLWIAGEGKPDCRILVIMGLGVIVMRAAGCVINDYADRNFDPYVSRTRTRPIAAGRVTPTEALAVFVVLIMMAFALVLQLNAFTILLSVIGAGLAVIYPFMKRYTYFPQVYLGLAFGWAVPMSFAAQTEAIPRAGWVIYLATIIWALIYDTQYAMVDRDDDLRIGVKSTAILFAEMDRVIIGGLQLLFLTTLALVGKQLQFTVYYYVGLLVAGALFVYQQWLIRERSKAGCFAAFLNNNWVGAVIFAGIACHYYLFDRL